MKVANFFFLFQAEDAVCLADYCDIMRCQVLVTQEGLSSSMDQLNTDIEIWREATPYQTALSQSSPRALVPVPPQDVLVNSRRAHRHELVQRDQAAVANHCSQTDKDQSNSNTPGDSENGTDNVCENLVDSSLPPTDKKQERLSELQKLKANCKPEELQKLKIRCEVRFDNFLIMKNW